MGRVTSNNSQPTQDMDEATKSPQSDSSAPFGCLHPLVGQLAELLVWVAPVGIGVPKHERWGRPKLLGFMVCRRVMNNADGPNTKVEYLRVNPTNSERWKKPFRECEHMFPSLEVAYAAAARAMDLPNGSSG